MFASKKPRRYVGGGKGGWNKSVKFRVSTNPDQTTQKPEELEKNLLRNLECQVCMEYMTPPIILCQNGHNICRSCRPKVRICPTCRQPFLQTRNYALEDLCYYVKYPCKFHDEGCKETFSGKYIEEHQDVCHHGTHTCLLGRVPEIQCDWSGPFTEFVTHIFSQHKPKVITEASFVSFKINNSASICLKYDQIFLCYKCFQEGKCYCAVYLFGTSDEASRFKYKVKLCAENKIENLSQVKLVRSITEGFEATFRGGHCVILDNRMLGQFTVNGVLRIQVRVKNMKIRDL